MVCGAAARSFVGITERDELLQKAFAASQARFAGAARTRAL
jgi:hypothetical protein